MAAGSGSRAVCRLVWGAILAQGPMTVHELADHINNRKTRYGSPLKYTWTPQQIVQFLIRSPLFYPDPDCPPVLQTDGRQRRQNPRWFAYPLDEVVVRLAGKTHVRTPTKFHPKFLRDAIEKHEGGEAL